MQLARLNYWSNTLFRNCYHPIRDVCNAVSSQQLLCAMPLNNFTMRIASINFQAQLRRVLGPQLLIHQFQTITHTNAAEIH